MWGGRSNFFSWRISDENECPGRSDFPSCAPIFLAQPALSLRSCRFKGARLNGKQESLMASFAIRQNWQILVCQRSLLNIKQAIA